MGTIEIKLSKQSGEPLYVQIADALGGLIESGAIGADTKLPAIRRFADSLGVNNVTVVNAYRALEKRGLTYSLEGSGTYAAKLRAMGDGHDAAVFWDEAKQNPDNVIINFLKGSTSKELFPVKEFKRVFNTVLDRDMGNAFEYEQGQGYEPLRESFRIYLERYGIQTGADRIQIISGAQQGVDIVAKTLLRQGDSVIAENPSYYGALSAFSSRGAVTRSIPILPDGMDIDLLSKLIREVKPKLIYCMPYFQTPSCHSYSLEKKRALLELAYKHNVYIIEEDNQSDFSYTAEPVVPLKALDYRNRVVFIKSFSKILMPGLRIGFMLMPRAITNAVIAAKHSADIETSGFLQRAFQLFVESRGFDEHLVKMKDFYERKYRLTKRLIDERIGGHLNYSDPQGGLGFWLTLRDGSKAEGFFADLSKRGVLVSEGAKFTQEKEVLPSFRISFSDLSDEEIGSGINIIQDILEQLGETKDEQTRRQ